jgi:EAL domain-containing protein (putative c-di-GMP-specific phosphodiesterase class I)
MQVVAEGVETLEQLAVLRELKCHLAQGFYFTQPATAQDTERLLARSPRW